MLTELWLQEDNAPIPAYIFVLIAIAVIAVGAFLFYKSKQSSPESTATPGVLRLEQKPADPIPSVTRPPATPTGNLTNQNVVPRTQNAAIAAREQLKQNITSGVKLTNEPPKDPTIPPTPVAPKMTATATDMIHEAEVLRESGRPDLAARKLRELVTREPGAAAAYDLLGDILAETDDLAGAANAYKHSLRINPKNSHVCVNLAKALERLDDIPGAIAAYRAATVADPANNKAFNNLGGLLAETGDMRGGVEAFRRALQINPSDQAAQENLALAEDLLREQSATS